MYLICTAFYFLKPLLKAFPFLPRGVLCGLTVRLFILVRSSFLWRLSCLLQQKYGFCCRCCSNILSAQAVNSLNGLPRQTFSTMVTLCGNIFSNRVSKKLSLTFSFASSFILPYNCKGLFSLSSSPDSRSLGLLEAF